MFENVGQRIKNYAKALFIGQLMLYIVGGIILIAMGVDGEEALIFVGIALLLVGWAIAWLNSVFIYGFGELIVKAIEIERNTRGVGIHSDEKTSKPVIESENVNKEVPKKIEHRWKCVDCGNLISKTPCPFCATKPKESPYWCLKCSYEGPYGDRCPSCGSSLKVYKTK